MNQILDQKLEKIKNWIFLKRPNIENFNNDYDIIGNKVLNSLHFMEFIYLIEELSENEIDVSELNFTDFSTINKIKENFFSHILINN